MHSHNRAFIRHAIEIPIEVAAQSESEHAESLKNLSFGGLAFGADQPYEPGTLLGIKIQAPAYPVQLAARVAWCRPCAGGPGGPGDHEIPDDHRSHGDHESTDSHASSGDHEAHHYEIGVAFEDSLDAFRIRMVEQVCQIERYRLSVLGCEGRELTTEEAAREWIARYADQFYPQT
jgi:hypothetical protein